MNDLGPPCERLPADDVVPPARYKPEDLSIEEANAMAKVMPARCPDCGLSRRYVATAYPHYVSFDCGGSSEWEPRTRRYRRERPCGMGDANG